MMDRHEVIRLVTDLVRGREPQPPAAEVLEERRAAAKRITAIEAEREKQLPRLADAEEKARKVWENAKRVELEARAKFADAAGQRMGAANGFERRIAENERFLRETADERIDDFIRELHAEHDRSRHAPFATGTEKSWSLRDGEQVREVSDYPQRVAKLAAIRAGIRQAEAVKLRVDCDVEVELTAIRKTIDEAGA